MQEMLIPSVPKRAIIEYKSHYEIWRIGYEKTQPKFVVENVRFAHDPEWRHRFWSMTYIASGESVFWYAGVGSLFWIAQFVPLALSLAR
jgi:hypothetical protein